jgi:hypothetical protein
VTEKSNASGSGTIIIRKEVPPKPGSNAEDGKEFCPGVHPGDGLGFMLTGEHKPILRVRRHPAERTGVAEPILVPGVGGPYPAAGTELRGTGFVNINQGDRIAEPRNAEMNRGDETEHGGVGADPHGEGEHGGEGESG